MKTSKNEPRFTKKEKLSLLILSVFIEAYGLIILGLNWYYESFSIPILAVFGLIHVIWSWCLIHYMESGFLDG